MLLLGLLFQAAPAAAHLVLAHAAQYGRNGPNLQPVNPQVGLTFDEWWFKGNVNYPPKDGVIMNLPSGGVFTASFTCSNGLPTPSYTGYTCGNNVSDAGSTHTKDKMNTPYDKILDVRGTALSIAYIEDATLSQPEDFTVISVNYSTPWVLAGDFHIPDNLPPCPPAGCLCQWGWIHSPDAGNPGEMYTMGYRCNVTGATGSTALPKPQVARKCPIDKNNCTVGAKQMHFWYQAERNNNFQPTSDPPFYNGDYGFTNGAQTDLFAVGDESLYADACDWAPGPQLYQGPWSNLAAGRPQWDGVQLVESARVYPVQANCTWTKNATTTATTASTTAASSTIATDAGTTTAVTNTATVAESTTTAAAESTLTEATTGTGSSAASETVGTATDAASTGTAAAVESATAPVSTSTDAVVESATSATGTDAVESTATATADAATNTAIADGDDSAASVAYSSTTDVPTAVTTAADGAQITEVSSVGTTSFVAPNGSGVSTGTWPSRPTGTGKGPVGSGKDNGASKPSSNNKGNKGSLDNQGSPNNKSSSNNKGSSSKDSCNIKHGQEAHHRRRSRSHQL